MLTDLEERRKQRLEEQKNASKVQKTTSTFHGDSLKDAEGRSYILPPKNLQPKPHKCYIPKKIVKAYVGHRKAVSVVRFYPKYGHMLLSGSYDTTVKLWDVNSNRKCLRTYNGHSEGVRDVCFTNDGLHFSSAAFDTLTHYWDTETGQVINTFASEKIPFVVRFNPSPTHQNILLIGG